jgi:hypothetical protein
MEGVLDELDGKEGYVIEAESLAEVEAEMPTICELRIYTSKSSFATRDHPEA